MSAGGLVVLLFSLAYFKTLSEFPRVLRQPDPVLRRIGYAAYLLAVGIPATLIVLMVTT